MKIVFKYRAANGVDYINAKDADPKQISKSLRGKTYGNKFIQVEGIDGTLIWIDSTNIAYIVQGE